MTYSDSGRILDRLTRLYPKSIDLALNRPKRLLTDLDNPERDLPPVVHFAGTNGKGSTLAMVRAGMEFAGKRVHAYVSPHLTRFHERIRLAGELIGEEELSKVLHECEAVNHGQPISLFEITTCAAFLAFSRHEADTLLLEVGLGGRLDATNVVDRPELTVISSVSLDHQQYLGETLPEIAREKAGILKPGVPCIVNRQSPDALEAIKDVADDIGARLLVQGEDWSVGDNGESLVYRDKDGLLELPRPRLLGPHQFDNAGAAVASLRLLGYDKPALAAALTRASWPARMQRLKTGPLVDAAGSSEVWLDGGHNEAAGNAVARTLNSMPEKTTRIICGMLTTKDVRSFLKSLRTAADWLYGITIPGERAAMPAAGMAAVANEVGFRAEAARTAEEAVRKSAREDPDGRILLCGSLYLAGRILRDNA